MASTPSFNDPSRATRTRVNPCTGALGANLPLDIRRGRPAGAQVLIRCSRHRGCWWLPAGWPVQPVYEVEGLTTPKRYRGRGRESEPAETPPHRAEIGFSSVPCRPLPASGAREAALLGNGSKCQKRHTGNRVDREVAVRKNMLFAAIAAFAALFSHPGPDGAAAQTRSTLDIYVVDVEGGNATLLVPPSGESLLIH